MNNVLPDFIIEDSEMMIGLARLNALHTIFLANAAMRWSL